MFQALLFQLLVLCSPNTPATAGEQPIAAQTTATQASEAASQSGKQYVYLITKIHTLDGVVTAYSNVVEYDKRNKSDSHISMAEAFENELFVKGKQTVEITTACISAPFLTAEDAANDLKNNMKAQKQFRQVTIGSQY